ncbi:MAG: TonB-dependent receptor [Chlorobi bacterium]|nr:TonB-dependent receptor [Chlorobiota bacterium]
MKESYFYKRLAFKFVLTAVFFLTGISIYSQSVKGIVYGISENKKEPLDAAVVRWLGTTKGTITESNGTFELSLSGISDKRLMVSYSGYKSDTISVEDDSYLEITLEPNTTTTTIEVEDEKKSTYFGNENAKTEIITSQELVKDACCDLAGCFGRNSSVEVAVTDIITDSKELKILGLEGAYTQILIDNLPLMSGLNVKYGVSSIPGTLIDKITISKGSNSVLQGYESISGIMNVLLKDKDNSDMLLLNGFVNSILEKQLNLNLTHSLNKKWNSILTLHSVQKSNRVDENGDGFLDNPLITRYMAYNKWKFSNSKNKTEFNIAGRYWNEERIGGERNFDIKKEAGSSQNYGQTIKINSVEGYSRFGKQFSTTNGIKMYVNSSFYDQKSFYGITQYDAKQTSFSFSGFYEFEYIERGFLKTGLSYRYQKIDEDIKFNVQTNKTYAGNYIKKESIPGIFSESSISFLEDKGSLMTGIRFDNHNEHDLIITPRALLRYQPDEKIVLRASIGSGFRTVNLLSEYSNILASSRNIIIAEKLEPEKVLNYGADVIFYFSLGPASGSLNIDFYRTDFKNKIIPDYDIDPLKVIFANLEGKAFSNVFQSEASVTILRNVDLKLAYKFIDIQYEKNGMMFEQPFNSKHRVLTTFSYVPSSKSWSASAGLNWFGKQRLPSTASNPPEYQRPSVSEPYTLINMQVNKNFKYFELYAGVENLLDFRQDNPIISANDPFGPYFDTSFIWGPTKGREFYAGFRFLLK